MPKGKKEPQNGLRMQKSSTEEKSSGEKSSTEEKSSGEEEKISAPFLS